MVRETVRVNLGPRSYDIVIATDDAEHFPVFVSERCKGRRALLVCDTNVVRASETFQQNLMSAGFKVVRTVLPYGEQQKCLHTVAQLYDRLCDMAADRQTVVVAVGGGVVGDVAGFAAATYARGLPLVMAPTTLLAMVDSSVGGKTGVNHPAGKNLIGAFHQPMGVWIDTMALATLPDREFRGGLAEVVKYGMILDEEFFLYLEANVSAIVHRRPDAIRHVVVRCCRLKADIVERDEREETGLRSVLNYGHTFAHAIEAVAGYGEWSHGEAVAAGMVCAARLAVRRGLIPSEVAERQYQLLRRFQLPTTVASLPPDRVLEAMRRDKKSECGQLRLILPKRLGEVALFDNVSDEEIKQAIAS